MLPLNADKIKVKELVVQDLHAVYPVYNENYDDIAGVVTLKIFLPILKRIISI
jgi:putative hemolysin